MQREHSVWEGTSDNYFSLEMTSITVHIPWPDLVTEPIQLQGKQGNGEEHANISEIH